MCHGFDLLMNFITQQFLNSNFSESEIEADPNLLPEAKISSSAEQLIDNLQADNVTDQTLDQLQSGLTRKLAFD